MEDKERRLWSLGLRFEVVVRGGEQDSESNGENGHTHFPMLKKCWEGGRCFEAQQWGGGGVVLPGISRLGSSKNNFKLEK